MFFMLMFMSCLDVLFHVHIYISSMSVAIFAPSVETANCVMKKPAASPPHPEMASSHPEKSTKLKKDLRVSTLACCNIIEKQLKTLLHSTVHNYRIDLK